MPEKQTVLLISTAEDLLAFAKDINSGWYHGENDLTVKLTADIDLGGLDQWVPIGCGGHFFSGVFDGGGHTVRNMTIKKECPASYGLFGFCTGTIENLNITGSITCVAGDVHSAVGGIAGLVDGGQINNCTADISIDSQKRSLGMYAGVVVGNVQGHSTVVRCLNRGTVDANDYDFTFLTLGNIVGRWEGEGAELQPFSRDTLRRTASSMTKEEL